jgi:hypothetical protein
MDKINNRIEKLEKSMLEKGDFQEHINEFYRSLYIIYGGGKDFPIPKYKNRAEFEREWMAIIEEVYHGKKGNKKLS